MFSKIILYYNQLRISLRNFAQVELFKNKKQKEGKGWKDKKVLASEVHRSLIYQHSVILVVQYYEEESCHSS